MNTDLLVLGAGPTGLAAAWRAAQSGLSVTVLERSDRIGGLSRSFEVDGVRVDLGSHRLHRSTPPEILADLNSLLGEDLQLRTRSGRLRVAGQWMDFPLRPAGLMRALPWSMLAGIGFDTLAGPVRRLLPRRIDTYAAVLKAGLGPTLYRELYAPFASKLWGLPGDRLSGAQVRVRVTADTPGKVLRRILQRSRTGVNRTFYYPRHGFGQIPEVLAAAAIEKGAVVRTGVPLEQLIVRTSGVTAVTETGEEFTARRVFTTEPLPNLVRFVSPGAPARVVDAARRLRFRALVVIHISHRGGRWTPYDAHYIPGDGTRLTRVSEQTNYRDSADDPQDRTALCIEAPCAIGDEIWNLSDEETVSQVLERLASLGLPPIEVGEWRVTRVPEVYPIYTKGYEADLDILERWVATVPNLTSFGRLGLFAHDSTHHAIEEAYAAADAFAGGRWDENAWRSARARFKAHVVED